MNVLTLPYFSSPKLRSRHLLVPILLLAFAVTVFPQRPEPEPKTIHGVVRDVRGQRIAEARVFVRDTETQIIRTLTTDTDGLYNINGLPADADYEVHAEFQGKESRHRIVSSFLNRQDTHSKRYQQKFPSLTTVNLSLQNSHFLLIVEVFGG